MRFLVYDGDAIFLKQLEKKLKKETEVVKMNTVISVNNKADFFEAIHKSKDIIDVIMINVVVNNESGIQIIKELEDEVKHIQVIFLSDTLHYASDVYEVDHIYFIMKEQLDMHLPRAIEKVNELLERKSDIVVLKKKNTSVLVSEKEILYCTRRDRATEIFLRNGEKIIVSAKLDQLEEKLAGIYMLRCHKSFIVSMRYIVYYTREEFVLSNGISIPISRTYIHQCREQFQEWINNENS